MKPTKETLLNEQEKCDRLIELGKTAAKVSIPTIIDGKRLIALVVSAQALRSLVADTSVKLPKLYANGLSNVAYIMDSVADTLAANALVPLDFLKDFNSESVQAS